MILVKYGQHTLTRNNEMNKFTARMYHYISGEMSLIVKNFDKLEDAIEEGIRSCAHSFKIYDIDGNICHDSHGHHDTYA